MDYNATGGDVLKEIDVKKSFGKNLRERRTQMQMTQSQLAELLGYSTKAVSKWESGSGLPSAALLPTIARVLNTDIDFLMRAQIEPVYFLGIDGGGTKTEFCLTNAQGKVIASCVLGQSNPNDIGMDACYATLKEGINAVCADIPVWQVSVFAGIAGAGTADYKHRLAKYLSTFGFSKAGCDSDAQCAIAAGLGREDGLIVLMGTGNVTFVQKDGAVSKIGGFNYLFDEGGSGYTIGRDAITFALKNEERGNVASVLYRMVQEKCGTQQVLDRLGDFYKEGKNMVARYAPLVFDAYDAGDADAARILDRNMAAIAEQIVDGAKILDQNQPKIVLFGGLTKKADVLLPMIKKHMNTDYEITVFHDAPVKGALLRAGLEEKYA